MGETRGPSKQGRANARQRAQQLRAAQERQRRQRSLLIGGVLIVALILVLGGGLLIYSRIHHSVQTQNATAASLPVDGVQCLGNETLAYHIHQHLTLYQDGKPVTLPANIGIPVGSNIPGGTCYYWLHVHDTTGVVHVESPTTQNYTLGQFLDIWQRTTQLDAQGGGSTQVSDAFVRALRAASPGDVHVYVGDKETSDYNSIPLTAHELITIEIGTPLQPPTTDYTFPAGE
jgi:hypothetical protein